jgi:hypothetical protein
MSLSPYAWSVHCLRLVIVAAFVCVAGTTTSCSLLPGSCEQVFSDLQGREAIGQIYFSEFEIQRERFLDGSEYPSLYKESVVRLLRNYREVHRILLENPGCLVDPKLEDTLKEGVELISEKISRAQESDTKAHLEMLGELSSNYQSMELWVKRD